MFLTIRGHLPLALTCLVAAVLLDRVDGIVARRTGTTSELGKQLDSLCDAISFGVAPAVVVASLTRAALVPCLLAGLFTLAAVWRLARFNVTGMDASHTFQGVPTTLAGAWFTIAFAGLRISPLADHTGALLAALLALLAPAMLAPVPVAKNGLLVKPLYVLLLPTLVAIWW